MRRNLLSIMVLVVLGLSCLPRQADAFGLRLGDLTVIEPHKDSLFAIGMDKDFEVIPFLAFNSGSLFAFDGSKMYIDAYFGLKALFPVAMGGRFKITLRADFMLKFLYPFDDLSGFGDDYGLALGGITGPGLIIGIAGPLALTFDVDVQFYKFVYPDRTPEDWHIALAFLGGIRF